MRWKIVVSLLPFIFPLTQAVAEFQLRYHSLSMGFGLFSLPIAILLLVEKSVARPFEFLLRPLSGFWSHNTGGPFPDGPLLPGSFVVAIVYSIILYVTLSLVSKFWRAKRV